MASNYQVKIDYMRIANLQLESLRNEMYYLQAKISAGQITARDARKQVTELRSKLLNKVAGALDIAIEAERADAKAQKEGRL